MKSNVKKLFFVTILTAVLSSCAELTSINNKIGEMAGGINRQLSNMPGRVRTIEDSALSTRKIESLYVKIKREFGFNTREEELIARGSRNLGTANIGYAVHGMMQDGFIHEIQPGTYYHMADTFKYGYLDIVLGKDSNKVSVTWTLKTKDANKAAEIKQRILKAIK